MSGGTEQANPPYGGNRRAGDENGMWERAAKLMWRTPIHRGWLPFTCSPIPSGRSRKINRHRKLAMFRHSFRLFNIRGIPLKVDVSWFIILLLVSFTLAEGVFKSRFPGLAASVRWPMGVSGAMLLFVSVLLHELAHSVVAQSKGMKVSGITLFVFGGVSEIAEEPPTPVTELWMTAVGPAMSVVIGVLFFAALM